MNVFITVHKATNLLAKDRNVFGKRTSSDPYVKVFYKGEAIGKTPTKKKTLNPSWEHILQHSLGDYEEKTILAAKTPACLKRPNHPSLLLVVFDHDIASKDDVLGQITIPISYKGVEKQWLTLQKGEPKTKYFCPNTQGKVLISIQIASTKLPPVPTEGRSSSNPFAAAARSSENESDDESIELGFKKKRQKVKSSNPFTNAKSDEDSVDGSVDGGHGSGSGGNNKEGPLSAEIDVAITLHKATNLLAKDRNMMGKHTTSDPYVKVFYNGDSIGKTFFKKKTLAPVWNQTLEHVIDEDEAGLIRNGQDAYSLTRPNHPSFLLVLYDHDNGSADDILGQVTIPIAYKGSEREWCKLETGEPKSKYYCKKTSGEIQVSIKITSDPLSHTVRVHDAKKKISESAFDDESSDDESLDFGKKKRQSDDAPKATIVLHQAANLLALDCNIVGKHTTSDPYALVFYKGEKVGKTPVKKKTLNPEWNSGFEQVVSDEEAELIKKGQDAYSMKQPGHPSFLLVLFDHDNGSSDDVLGVVTVPISYNGIENQWYTLERGKPNSKYHCKKTQGEIQVSIQFSPGAFGDESDNENPFADSDSDGSDDENEMKAICFSEDAKFDEEESPNEINEDSNDPLGEAIQATLKLHKAEDLLPLDCNMRGKETSSDPYVKVFYNGDNIGKTATIKKCLNPEWDHTLVHKFDTDDGTRIKMAKASDLNKPDHPSFLLVLFDHDNGSSDDVLGQVTIPVSIKGLQNKWYILEKGAPDSKYYTKRTQGKIQVSLEIGSVSATPNPDDDENDEKTKEDLGKSPGKKSIFKKAIPGKLKSSCEEEPKPTDLEYNALNEDSAKVDNDRPSGVGGSNSGYSVIEMQHDKKHYRPGPVSCYIILLILVVVICVSAILVVGFAVINGGDLRRSAITSSNPGLKGSISLNSPTELQLLLETSEKVVTVCSADNLNKDMTECFNLCHTKICCFEDKNGPYNCEDDTSKLCGVYAGCEALTKGMAIMTGSTEEN
mmetsp:Transcript_19936/g.41187  ORF Transcript_19936/g.41187 Transcript_19936/m.41187 type:complete len:1004 (-) Transcript_19936:240-3251(-)